MKTFTLKFNRLSAVIVLMLCMLCANNVKSYAQPTITLYGSGGTLTPLNALMGGYKDYIENVDEDFNPGLHPHHVVINAVEIEGTFSAFRILSVTSDHLTSVGDAVFSMHKDLKEVNLSYAKKIGANSFGFCRGITKVQIPEVNNIDESAFMYCSGLVEISMPKVRKIGDNAFTNCTKLQSVSLPSVETIGGTAFSQCTVLKDVNASRVTSIGQYAFGACTALTEIVDFSRLENLGDMAFMGCSKLEQVILEGAETIGNSAFENCGSLVYIHAKKVKSLDRSVFRGCDALISVFLDEIEAIDDAIFMDKSPLQFVSIDKAKTIGSHSFAACTSLDMISLPEVTAIGQAAFVNCHSLIQISMPKVTSIGKLAFASCESLKLWDIGRGLEKPTTVAFGPDIFGSTFPGLRAGADIAANIELIIGENVLPKPAGNTWNGMTWKSVDVQPAISGIVETGRALSLQVYPNPAKESVTVDFELAKTSDVKISLIDISGKEMAVFYTGFAPAGMFTKTFGTAHLPSGVYLLNVSIAGKTTAKKIIIE